MGFHVYVLRCADGSYYTGHTDQLENRIVAHQEGLIPGYTEERRPVELVVAQELESRDEAFRRERQIKGWSRAKKAALIKGEWDKLPVLSRSKNPE